MSGTDLPEYTTARIARTIETERMMNMSDKRFIRLLAGVIVVCTLLTFAHVGYAIHLYRNCSMISFIANGR